MYGIFTYIYHRNHPNVGRYTSPMDPMGHATPHTSRSTHLQTHRWNRWAAIASIGNHITSRFDPYKDRIQYPQGVHGIWYLYTHIYQQKSTIHAGKYTIVPWILYGIEVVGFYTVSWEKNPFQPELKVCNAYVPDLCFDSWSRNKWSYIQILWWIKSVLVEYNLNSSMTFSQNDVV